MDKPPTYLLFYLLRIRKHSGEEGYFTKRFENMEREKMAREAYMLRELHKLGFVALPDDVEKIYDPLVFEENGVTYHRVGREHRIPYAPMFLLLPAGHYIMRELAFDMLGKGVGTAVAAAVGILVGMLIAA